LFKKLFGAKDNKYKFTVQEPTTKTCPYCGANLEKIPTRKKKCPECGNYIFVRFGKLYTEDEKNIKDFLGRNTIQELGINRDDFNKTRQKLSEEFGAVASVNDTAWRLLNSINMNDKSYLERMYIYKEMHHILLSEGKNARHIKFEIERMGLLHYKQEGWKKVSIVASYDDNVCDRCKKLNGKAFDIDDALREMPIPTMCENEQCRCIYSPFGSI